MRISVIIPVLNGSRTLTACLRALAESQYPASECIVVDDGSTDESADIARRFGAVVLSVGGGHGPARARNLGARSASGDLLLFIDADVAVHADALGKIAARFEAEPDLDALMGAYDDAPSEPGLVSQFKNLQHAFVHQQGNRQAFTFWSGCGAVKRSVLAEQGGFDESYAKPSIEDIELGFRMLKSGRRLALDPSIQCKHLKAWSIGDLVRTDVLQRGIPWTELILRTRFFPADLNLRWSQRASVILLGLLFLFSFFEGIARAAGQAVFSAPVSAAAILSLLAAIWFLNRAFYRFLAARKGWGFSLLAIPLHTFYFLYSGVSFALGAGFFIFRGVPMAALPQAAAKTSIGPRSVGQRSG
jgi:glycosyltransferase involved in cell wall biosynthesis